MDRGPEEAQARNYLSRVRKMGRRLGWKRSQVMALREMATNATSQISDMPRSDSPNLQRMEALVCKIVDLEQEIQQEATALADTRIETALMICHIANEQHQRVLTERYLHQQSWKTIAGNMGYSLSYVFRLHEDALCQMEELLLKGEGGAAQ